MNIRDEFNSRRRENMMNRLTALRKKMDNDMKRFNILFYLVMILLIIFNILMFIKSASYITMFTIGWILGIAFAHLVCRRMI